jgi:hypothetical protein
MARVRLESIRIDRVDPDRLSGAIELSDGTAVRRRTLREPVPPGLMPTYGLYLVRVRRARAASFAALTETNPDSAATWRGTRIGRRTGSTGQTSSRRARGNARRR